MTEHLESGFLRNLLAAFRDRNRPQAETFLEREKLIGAIWARETTPAPMSDRETIAALRAEIARLFRTIESRELTIRNRDATIAMLRGDCEMLRSAMEWEQLP